MKVCCCFLAHLTPHGDFVWTVRARCKQISEVTTSSFGTQWGGEECLRWRHEVGACNTGCGSRLLTSICVARDFNRSIQNTPTWFFKSPFNLGFFLFQPQFGVFHEDGSTDLSASFACFNYFDCKIASRNQELNVAWVIPVEPSRTEQLLFMFLALHLNASEWRHRRSTEVPHHSSQRLVKMELCDWPEASRFVTSRTVGLIARAVWSMTSGPSSRRDVDLVASPPGLLQS